MKEYFLVKCEQKIFHLISLIFIILLSLTSGFAQGTRPQRNIQSFTPYAVSDFETVDLQNGNLMLHYSLASLPPGRGGLSASINLTYNSKLWNTASDVLNDQYPNGEPASWDLHILDQNYDGLEWQYSFDYRLRVESRRSLYNDSIAPKCPGFNANFNYKVKMLFPDGSEHEFRPVGYNDQMNDGYFNILPSGIGLLCNVPSGYFPTYTMLTTSNMVYYSTDGTYTRLEVQHVSTPDGLGNYHNPWTLYLPDGRKVTGVFHEPSVPQRIEDRNGNYVEIQNITYNGHPATKIIDQVGRYLILERDSAARRDYIRSWGTNNQEIIWTVIWKDNWVRKMYKQHDPTDATFPGADQEVQINRAVVDQIILPTQLGSQTFTFGYSGSVTQLPSYTNGWGELNSITTPTGAQISYQYQRDGQNNLYAEDVVHNKPTRKDFTYLREYDGSSTPVTETWTYAYGLPGGCGSVTSPNGGVSSEYFGCFCQRDPQDPDRWDYNLPAYCIKPDGTKIEKLWEANTPYGARSINPVLKKEFISVKNAAGNYVFTAIKIYNHDKNGNPTQVAEYDWVAYSSVPRDPTLDRPTGVIPGEATIKRVSVNSYYNATPDSADSTTDNEYVYHKTTSPPLRVALASTEIRAGFSESLTKTRSEMTYDNYSTTGNLTETRSWDSFKNGVNQPNSNPLSPSNSISTTAQYDLYGNPTLITDAKGNQTQITYGSVGGYTGLYPTETRTAYGTSIQRTATAGYDFHTGLVTTATDVDNNLSTATEYEVFGRATRVKTAVSTPLEIWTQTEYDDLNRRVIVRSDLETKGDGKKIGIQHFDQLGRVRLSRSIENAATENSYNEADGIKVQTRYLTTNPNNYQLISNPYRAATSTQAVNEPEMGWTRSMAVNTGRHSETETFAGAALPPPWGTNSNSSGKVQTDIDADRMLVTDQAGKQRISETNALGQLINVWEVTAADSNTEAITFGSSSLNAYKTSYSYDTLNNLTTVNQGSQTRSFSYSSLSRLLSANNPESGTISYIYDNNGNLTQKTDARQVVTGYVYDALNRVTNRNYSAPTGLPNYQAAPNVVYTYDDPAIANSKGRLTKVAAILGGNVTAETKYQVFDILGRVVQSQQWVDGASYGEPMTYTYNLSGAMIEQKYPSGRVVKNVLDNDGDLAIVESKKSASDIYRTYANSFIYTAAGAVSSVRLGNGKFENTQFNSRLQPVQIGLGSSATDQNLLKLNFNYVTTNNNGNVLSQTIAVPTVGATTGFTATQAYTYDSLNRLKSAEETIPNQTGWKQTFKYDRYGNRNFDTTNVGDTTTIPAGCAAAVCNPQVDPATNKLVGYQFDNAGNTKVDAENRTFIYDGENKQTEVKDQYGVSIGKYFYDGDGKRVKKISNTETTVFVYNAGGQLVAEYSTQTSQQPQVSYLTTDHLGSPRINTDANGAVTARHDYQPFGEEIQRASYGVDKVRKQFATYERDRETDLDFAQARMYNKTFGRFSSTDPILISKEHPANPQRWNLFIYVINNPLTLNDPDGKKPKRIIDVYLTFDTTKEIRRQWNQLRREARRNGIRINIYRSDNGTASAEKFIQSIMAKGRSVVVVGHSHGTLESVRKGQSTGIFYGMGVEFGGKSVLSNRKNLSGDNPEATDTVDGLNAKAKNIAVFTCDFGNTFVFFGIRE